MVPHGRLLKGATQPFHIFPARPSLPGQLFDKAAPPLLLELLESIETSDGRKTDDSPLPGDFDLWDLEEPSGVRVPGQSGGVSSESGAVGVYNGVSTADSMPPWD